MRKLTPLGLLFALGTGAGCGPIPPDFPSQEELFDVQEEYDGFFVSSKRGVVYTAAVNDGGILASELINLGRYRDADDHAIRGVAFRQRVELKVSERRVTGTVSGTLPFDLKSDREGSTLRFRGLVRGFPADFRFDDQELHGVIGRCSYQLTSTGEQHYDGRMSCREQSASVRVKLPAELRRWNDAELGAALGILLGGV